MQNYTIHTTVTREKHLPHLKSPIFTILSMSNGQARSSIQNQCFLHKHTHKIFTLYIQTCPILGLKSAICNISCYFKIFAWKILIQFYAHLYYTPYIPHWPPSSEPSWQFFSLLHTKDIEIHPPSLQEYSIHGPGVPKK